MNTTHVVETSHLTRGLVFLFRQRRDQWHSGPGEAVLAERCEITEEEYRRRASVLKGGGG